MITKRKLLLLISMVFMLIIPTVMLHAESAGQDIDTPTKHRAMFVGVSISEWPIRLWTSNGNNGVTIAAEHLLSPGDYSPNNMTIICLDGQGKELWRREVTHGDSHFILPLVIRRSEQNKYEIWGSLSISTDDKRLFYLSLDENGNYIKDVFWNYEGNQYSYLDGRIYAVTYGDEVRLTIQDELRTEELQSFEVKK